MTRSAGKEELLRGLGAEPLVCDVYDLDRLSELMSTANPDVVIHELTAIPDRLNPRKHAEEFAETNRLRTEGTHNLHDAAVGAGAGRMISQSVAFAYKLDSDELATEDEPLALDAPEPWGTTVNALAEGEETVMGSTHLEGLVLRYGYFYGPGTAFARGGSYDVDAKRGRLPVVGPGGGVFSFIHVDDAALATVAALGHGAPGAYNVVDDDPAPARDWIPVYTEAVGARKPRRAPKFLARLLAGKMVTDTLVRGRGVSNEKAKRELGWQPGYPSWREGFRTGLG